VSPFISRQLSFRKGRLHSAFFTSSPIEHCYNLPKGLINQHYVDYIERSVPRHTGWFTTQDPSKGSWKKNEWMNWKSNGKIDCTKLHGFNKLKLQQNFSR
jgi:hypothetical protein